MGLIHEYQRHDEKNMAEEKKKKSELHMTFGVKKFQTCQTDAKFVYYTCWSEIYIVVLGCKHSFKMSSEHFGRNRDQVYLDLLLFLALQDFLYLPKFLYSVIFLGWFVENKIYKIT